MRLRSDANDHPTAMLMLSKSEAPVRVERVRQPAARIRGVASSLPTTTGDRLGSSRQQSDCLRGGSAWRLPRRLCVHKQRAFVSPNAHACRRKRSVHAPVCEATRPSQRPSALGQVVRSNSGRPRAALFLSLQSSPVVACLRLPSSLLPVYAAMSTHPRL